MAKPLVSWLLAVSWNALCEVDVGKDTDGGNTDVGEVTNALESPPEALLKGLLGERAAGGWEEEPELNGFGKFEKVWGPETVSTPGELAGVELEESLLPKRLLYCGGPPAEGAGCVGAAVSEKTLSSWETAAYLS